jgi:hypothetical protein
MMDQVFISYSHQDQEFVSRLALDLEKRGAQVWIDREDIHAGTKWQESIAQGVRACKAFLLVVSPESLKSEWANREFRLAVDSNRPVIPLLYRKARIPRELAAPLESYQYIDFRQGSYGENLADLVASLAALGVELHAAQELNPEELARRNRERLLGEPGPTAWGAVLGRVPGWALAWALGWMVIGAIVPILVEIGWNRKLGTSTPLDLAQLLLMPVWGLIGGFAGGLLAGLFTMLALRRNAASIRWKHMAMAFRIWAIAGTIVCVVIFGFFFLSSQGPAASAPVDCSGLGPGDCFMQSMGQGLSDILSQACFGLLIMIFGGAFSAIGILLVGMVAGGAAVRRIRRLEPGILGRQAFWVVLGWGLGAVLAMAGVLFLMSRGAD